MVLDQSYLQRTSYKQDIFKGKVVFVTGGAGTICRVQAEALVLLGANAAIIGRNEEKTVSAAKEISQLRPGVKVIGVGNTDVRNIKSLQAAVDQTVKELGRIDFVIAGAAGNFLCDINSLSANAFKSVIDIDVLGSYNTLKATYNQLVKNKGEIIFISATLHYQGTPFQSHVSAAKAGIDALSQTIAVELGPLGVRSNIIAPGAVANTEGFKRLIGHKTESEVNSKIPLQRPAKTEDIANTTVFLLSPAGEYITGDKIVVDGGQWHLGNGISEGYPKLIKERSLKPSKL
ncbi:3-oxoacyl-[acyl-carrier-protein] reductase [Wickerhamomyces ciferrii]|uniref:2,4-dienoyl-CoA reductase [(3E)-enoyl-CoA-producing] n=1 Tax=Wickerhamomyces ciferrii (strain ATCC 14091 / BCRC 22168 / CBS 111 / JCM 3599 / NBRC 0793 / NRRL Y-1031 F-60-10) TaxID=1206466 RepID=K0KYL6_WICCF|nr:3-oxoacyl-[acyl-carrier-protein] reductase [Wickerhamomyces ciferrii]CCH47167.1 3-oxoacyl-[acyl-carrier-protein] reductase [Wickerhamomyces ciferrii]